MKPASLRPASALSPFPTPKAAAGKGIRRREFLKTSGLALGALAALPQWTSHAADAVPAVNRVTVALIGWGAMGRGHLQRLLGDPGFQVLGVCDADRTRRDEAQAAVEAKYAAERASGAYRGCLAVQDYRELLTREDLDAVVIATPDHWHALQAIDAARAGKDVYLEKPVSVTIEEGRRLVEVVRRYGRVFQTGTQYRSIPTIRQVCSFVRAGGLGRVKQVFALLNPVSLWTAQERCQPFAATLTPDLWKRTYAPVDFALPAEAVPEWLDWNLWVGPAPWRPYNRLYHANPVTGVVPWSFDSAFGVTSLTWHLAHSADVIQWALGVERGGPVEIIHPATGRFPTFTCRYASGTLLHLVDHWGQVKELYQAVPKDARLAGNFGGVFVGERGWITSMSTGGPIEGAPVAILNELQLHSREVNIGANDHHADWLAAIRSRGPTHCDAEIGHRTATVGHLVNLSDRLGRSLRWDPAGESAPEDAAANRLRGRAPRSPWRL